MANAIKKISVQRGYDVTEYLLNCFGGAGGQHACLVADALGMEAVLIHPSRACFRPMASGLSSVFASRSQALMKPLAEGFRRESTTHRKAAKGAVVDELAAPRRRRAVASRPVLHIRYDGTDTALPVRSQQARRRGQDDFETAHKAQFGFV